MRGYSNYNDTNLDWLGKVPSHWAVVKNKYLASYTKGRNPAELLDKEEAQESYPYLIMEYLRGKTTQPKYAKLSDGLSLVKEGQPLVIWDGSNAGEFVKGKVGILASTMAAATLKQNVLPQFYWYLTVIIENEMRSRTVGMGIPHVDGSELNNLFLCFPKQIDEQEAIATFLDRETARIDKLIAEKQIFIKLLKEKRQALISHVVTKGLDPNVKMKDSGVEWIGEVPEHWEVTKLRYLGRCQNGINIGGEYFGSGYPFVSYGDVYKNRVLPSMVKGLVQSSNNDQKHYSVKTGDIFFTRTSETIEEIGVSSVCKSAIEHAVFAGFLIRFRPLPEKISLGYAEYYFQNEKLRAFFVKEMNLVTRASLSQELLKRMPVLIPPEEEQREISEHLQLKIGRIELLITETEHSIILLKERRTGLISSAVTGKIDVRSEAHSLMGQSNTQESASA